jgi:signal transduction histidine kinase
MLDNKRSIATIVVFIIVSIVSMLLSIAGLIGYKIFSSHERENLYVLNDVLADQAAYGLTLPIWNLDDTQIRQTIEGIMQEKTVYAIVVKQANSGNIMKELIRDSSWKPVETERAITLPGFLVKERDIMYSKEKIGSVKVFMTTEFLENQLQKTRLSILLGIVFVAIILILSLYFLLRAIVLKPLMTLEQYAYNVSHGKEVLKQIDEHRFIGELNSLILSIANMVLQLQSRYAEVNQTNERLKVEMEERLLIENSLQKSEEKLKELNSELENRVKQRTNELEMTNKELNNEISLRKKSMEELKSAQALLVQSEKMASLGVLTAGIAHEINNPINFINASIYGLNKIIADMMSLIEQYEQLSLENFQIKHKDIEEFKTEIDFNDLKEGIKILSENIEIGVSRTSEIVKGLKTFSRSDVGIKTPFNINTNLDLTLMLLQNQYNGLLNINRQYNEIPDVMCYPGKINQVFMNILANSIDSIIGKRETSDFEEIIIRSTQVDENWVKVEISDTGVGIPEKIINNIFEPFFTTKDVGKGTGLGLAISSSIIKNHKGEITVNNNKEKGVTFTILLPINA